MPSLPLRAARACTLLAAGLALAVLTGCTAPSGGPAPDSPAGGDGAGSGATTEETAVERPEGLDASLPVPPGVLISATPEASAWEYVYGEVTSEEARAFAQGLKDAGFDQKVTVDSDGVEQWYLQSADWAVKLEETHDSEQLLYWVDPISE